MALTEIIQTNPRLGIIAIAAVISFFISLVNYFILDIDRMREIKGRQKAIQKEIKEHQKAGNHDKVMKLNKEMMAHMGESMKHSFKPMLITIIPILVVFSLIKTTFAETAIAGSWFWWYIFSAIVASMVFRKLFKLP